jgi:hypothetical protein
VKISLWGHLFELKTNPFSAQEWGLTNVQQCYTLQIMPKDLTAVRLRPEQLKELAKLAAQDKEASVSSLIRRAVDDFLAKHKRKREGN